MLKIALVNPNTSKSTTSEMVRIAEASLGKNVKILGYTVQRGVTFIKEPKSLALAGRAVEELVPLLKKVDGVVISAFGDPGLQELRRKLSVPVTGIAEASMFTAARNGQGFAVVTTTPQLREVIAKTAKDYGHRNFRGTWVTPGDPTKHFSNLENLKYLLTAAIERAQREAIINAVIIGGGPLATIAKELQTTCTIQIVEPLPEAMRLSLKRITEQV